MKISKFINNNLSELLRGGIISLIFKVGGIGAGYLFFILLSRWYGPYYVGIFSISWTLLMIGSVVGKWGIDTAIVRFISESKSLNNSLLYQNYFKKGFSVVIFFSVLSMILIFIFRSLLIDLFYSSKVDTVILTLTAISILPFSIMGFYAESFRGLKKIVLYSVFQSGTIYVIVIIITSIIYFYFSKDFYIIESLLVTFCLLCVLAFIIYNSHHKKLLISLNKFSNEKRVGIKQILAVSTPMLLTNSLYLIMNWTDILMLGYFENETQTGIYNVAVKTAALGSVAIAAVNSIAAPRFAEEFNKKGKAALSQIVKQSTLLSLVLSTPIFIIIFAFPEFLLNFFGTEFIQAKTSMLILTLGQFINTFSGSTLYLLNMTGKEKAGRNILAAGAILNLFLNLFLIPAMGIKGAAIATMSSTVLWNTLAVFYIYKHYGFLTYPFLKKFKNA